MNISNRKLIALLALILVLAAAAGLVVYYVMPGGTQVLVTVNGVEYGTYPLHTDTTMVIGPADGSWYNTLVIEDGRAYVAESDCDNQICVHTPALAEDTIGIIVCLPHGVVVELR
ncbi:MAG: NusG domain II-containing protein, partial [Faecousia sp.]